MRYPSTGSVPIRYPSQETLRSRDGDVLRLRLRRRIRLFEQAAGDARGSALAQGGIALALGPNLNDRAMEGRMPAAYAALVKARDLAQREPGRVRDLVEALAVRYTHRA